VDICVEFDVFVDIVVFDAVFEDALIEGVVKDILVVAGGVDKTNPVTIFKIIKKVKEITTI